MKTKKTLCLSALLFVLLFTATCLCACKSESNDLWSQATYTKDSEFGTGKKTVKITVQADKKSIVLTIHSNSKTVGDALLENKLIEGDNGDFGLYIKKVIGIKADYDKDGAYWSFNKDGKYMSTGVDATEFKNNDHYELVYTKQ